MLSACREASPGAVEKGPTQVSSFFFMLKQLRVLLAAKWNNSNTDSGASRTRAR